LVTTLGDRVFDGIENSLVVVGPGDGIHSLGVVTQQFTSAQILYRKCVLAIASIVGGVSQEVTVFTDAERSEGHERLSFGEFIDVEQDFFGSIHAAPFSAADAVLPAGFGAHIVEIAAFFVRHFDVGLFHPA